MKKLPDGPEWVYELKLDGFRAQAIREVDGVRLLSRNGKDLSKRFPGVVSDLTHALLPNTVVDGDLVAMDEDNRPSFQALQNAQSDTRVTFYAFDILMDRGHDVRALPLRDRLAHMDAAFHPTSDALLCQNFPGPSSKFVAAVRRLGGEGVVAKHLDKPYEAEGKRSGAWRKLRLKLARNSSSEDTRQVLMASTRSSSATTSLLQRLPQPNALRYPRADASTLRNLRNSSTLPASVLALSRRAAMLCFQSWTAAALIDARS